MPGDTGANILRGQDIALTTITGGSGNDSITAVNLVPTPLPSVPVLTPCL